MSKWFVVFGIFIPKILLGASGSDSESHGIPVVVWFQVLNFTLFAGLLWFLLKTKVKTFYLSREQKFQERFKEASIKKEEALQRLKNFEEKSRELLATKDVQLEKAQKSATNSAQKLLDQANVQIQKIKQESKETADLLTTRAYEELKENLLENAIESVRLDVRDNMSSKQHLALIKKYNKRVSDESI